MDSEDANYVSVRDWRTVVDAVPLVSVDLVVTYNGGVVLGKRRNEPAKGRWFVPGGRVMKNETFEDAVHRIAGTELGCDINIDRQLGVYEHFYDTSEFEGIEKHYVPIGFVVTPEEWAEFRAEDQHTEWQKFMPPIEENLHPYVDAYLSDANIL